MKIPTVSKKKKIADAKIIWKWRIGNERKMAQKDLHREKPNKA